MTHALRSALALTLATTALGACATQREATDSVAIAGSAVGEAVAQPLKDLNLVQDPIPAALKQAMKDPYQNPERVDCAQLEHEVRSLDLALGPDVDIPAPEKGLRTQGSEAVAGAAANLVKDAASELIPFRTVVRRLTGAEKNAEEMRQALKAGDLRRAYLKGLGLERGCAYPAAPAPGKPGPGPGPAPTKTMPVAAPAAQPTAASQPAAQPAEAATSPVVVETPK